MDLDEVVREISKNVVMKIDRDDLTTLLERAETIREEDTTLAGVIRVLSLDGLVLIQEETPEGEVLVRRMASTEAAHELLDRRLADYERMWDGCGCTIDYFAPTIDT